MLLISIRLHKHSCHQREQNTLCKNTTADFYAHWRSRCTKNLILDVKPFHHLAFWQKLHDGHACGMKTAFSVIQLICLLNYLFQPLKEASNRPFGSKTLLVSYFPLNKVPHLYNGHTLTTLLSFLLAMVAARFTGSLRKSNSFSDSMHCFLNSSITLDIRNMTLWAPSRGKLLHAAAHTRSVQTSENDSE